MSGACDEDVGHREQVSQAPPVAVELELAPGGAHVPVGRLVSAGVAGRLGLTVDRIEPLRQAVDVALGQPGPDRPRSLVLTPAGRHLELAFGPLDGAQIELDELERVLSRLVDEVGTRQPSPGEVWVDLRLALPANGSAS